MISPSRVWRRMQYLFRRSSIDAEMEEEMRQHLQMEVEDQIRRGVPSDDARRNALLAFGGIERFKEDARDARGVRLFEDVWRDLTYTRRTLHKHKGYTLAATGILSVGVAGTVIVTSVVNYLLFRPPPIDDPDSVVIITERWRNNGWWNSTFGTWVYPYAHYEDLRDATGDIFVDLAGFRHEMFSVNLGDDVRSISGGIVSANYFTLLNLRPAAGRLFVDRTEPSGFEVVLSHDFWQNAFGANPDVLGRVLYIDSRAHHVIGVTPEGFSSLVGIMKADVWIPTATFDSPPSLTFVGRLLDGVHREQAAVALAPIVEATPSVPPGGEINAVELDPVRGVPTMMRDYAMGFSGALTGIVLLVLFIGISNLSALMLARATNRRREVSVRLAMGASRARVGRQLLVESLALCLIGAALGSIVAWWFISTIPPRIVPPAFGLDVVFPFDLITIGAGILVALIASIGSGVGPALRGTRLDLASALRGRDDGRPRRRAVIRTAIVGAQLTISLVLLLMAGLFVRVLRRSLDIDPGFVPQNVGVASIQIRPHGYDERDGWELIEATLERVAAEPGITGATAGRWAPLSGGTHGGSVVPIGANGDGSRINIYFGVVHPTYFETMQVPFVVGRTFSRQEGRSRAMRVAVVNETLARELSQDGNAVGLRFRFEGEVWEVIGVVRNGRYVSLDESPRSYVFFPMEPRHAQSATFHVRSAGSAVSGLEALRRSLAVSDPNIALEFPDDFAERLNLLILPQRIALWFIATFGVIGMALAATGIYGAVGYQVARRIPEFGIRVALGAQRRDVIWHVVKNIAATTAIAVLVGGVISFGLASYMSRTLENQFIFNVRADPFSFAGISAFLVTVALLAALLPARRAARVDPLSAIRVE